MAAFPLLMLIKFPFLALLAISTASLLHAADFEQYVPSEAPRTWVLTDMRDAFRTFATEGEGAAYYKKIRADFDAYWMDFEVPEQPAKYGDPDPRKRTPDKVILWRKAQDTCNRIATLAEAATLLWLVSGEERYLEKAQEILLDVAAWDQDGVANIYYNDEAHFRLWRKLPGVYDQLRDTFTEDERAAIIASFRERGRRSIAWIREGGVEKLSRNSVEQSPSSHPVRFMAMTGTAGLALWDDIPEARDWYAFAYKWYRDVFTPWGGADGGWAEGVAYWRGVYEHAIFQDALVLIDDPLAYDTPFWRETGYFQLYFVQPYLTTSFGDMSNAGKFNMEPGVHHFLKHLARVLQDGYLASYASLYTDERPLPREYGIKTLWRGYPTATEYLLRDFVASQLPEPEPKPLSELPPYRYFEDIGWVGFHSALGDPENDIQLSFKSSPYGSFSHSHADQNAFILNAFGENLAINSGYREYHRSHHHAFYTRATRSKNAVLINLRGQDVRNKAATGEIRHFEVGERYAWASGESTPAYQLLQPQLDLETVRRDVVMIDQTYFLIRDRIIADDPFMTSWLIHAERPIAHNAGDGTIHIFNGDAHLGVWLQPLDNTLRMKTWSGFDVAVDPDYVDPEGIAARSWITAPNVDQFHLRADLVEYQEESTIFAVLYPTRRSGDLADVSLHVVDESTVEVSLPGGKRDRISFKGDTVNIE